MLNNYALSMLHVWVFVSICLISNLKQNLSIEHVCILELSTAN